MNDKELKILNADVRRRGIAREAYLRCLINGYIPIGNGLEGYVQTLQQLRCIGTNINQIARIANMTGIVDSERYHRNYEDLLKVIVEIQLKEPTKQYLVERKNENEKN